MIKVPIYRDLTKGDLTKVGEITLDPKLIPEDPFFSISLVHNKRGPYVYVPSAASLVDDYNLFLGLGNCTKTTRELLMSLMLPVK